MSNLTPHILLVMKWLRKPESVSGKDLRHTADAADAAADATADAADAASDYCAVYTASYASTKILVNKYFEETGEDRADYEKELGNG